MYRKTGNRKVTKDFNLAVLYPHLAEEWHPTKNFPLTPYQVAPFTLKRVWWKCSFGHEWKALIPQRADGSACPFCLGMRPSKDYNLQTVHPDWAKQWHPTKNGKLKPTDVTPGSEKRVWWICENNHTWNSPVYNRKNHGCPECAKQRNKEQKGIVSMVDAAPHLIEQWHPTKNQGLLPQEFTYGSRRKVWWMCAEGHEWESEIKHRVKGTGCPFCSGHRPSKENNLLAVNPSLAAEWHPTLNGDFTPNQVTPNSERFAWWLCPNGHEYDAQVGERNSGTKCPVCLGRRKNKTSIRRGRP